MRILLVIDSFKGCLTSTEANAAAREGVWRTLPEAEVISLPVSDGGEGWLDAFYAASGGTFVETTVCDPLMRPIQAKYLVQGNRAVIEIARASGLTLLHAEERNPLLTTSYGTGQLIADAVCRGCRDILVGLGGSATSDAGYSMIRALHDAFGTALEPFADVRITLGTDVVNPLFGPEGAAYVFAPQKGATPAMVVELDSRARTFAEESARCMGYDCSNEPGAGAAGGLGYAFMQYLHAERRSGIDLLLDAVGFDALLADASLVITGEGRADRQTLMGKVPMGILRRAQRQHVPVILLAGQVEDEEQLLSAGFTHVECIHPLGFALSEALLPDVTRCHISDSVSAFFPFS